VRLPGNFAGGRNGTHSAARTDRRLLFPPRECNISCSKSKLILSCARLTEESQVQVSGRYASRIVTGGIGHNVPQEAPQEFAQAIIDVDGF
jgi:hypothetical protein